MGDKCKNFVHMYEHINERNDSLDVVFSSSIVWLLRDSARRMSIVTTHKPNLIHAQEL